MRENLEVARLLTKEKIKRAAMLSLHAYAGATADEWQDQVEALREGNGGCPANRPVAPTTPIDSSAELRGFFATDRRK